MSNNISGDGCREKLFAVLYIVDTREATNWSCGYSILKTPQSSIPHSTTGEHYEPPMGSIQGYIQLSR